MSPTNMYLDAAITLGASASVPACNIMHRMHPNRLPCPHRLPSPVTASLSLACLAAIAYCNSDQARKHLLKNHFANAQANYS